MDVAGTLGSLLWSDTPKTQPDASLSVDDLARLITAEGDARKASLEETQKQLDWRFVHFADEFQRRLDSLEGKFEAQIRHKTAEQDRESNLLPPCESVRRLCPDGGASEDQQLHLLEGKLAITETRVSEVQRLAKHLEVALEEVRKDSDGRLAEAEAWLKHFDRRLGDAECHLGGRRGAGVGRLTPVERLTLEGQEASRLSGHGSSAMSVRSMGSGCSGPGMQDLWSPPLGSHGTGVSKQENGGSGPNGGITGFVSNFGLNSGSNFNSTGAGASVGRFGGISDWTTKVQPGDNVSPASSQFSTAASQRHTPAAISSVMVSRPPLNRVARGD